MPSCKLTTDLLPSDCISLPTGGVSGSAYGIDYEDWLAATKTVAADGSISAIALPTGTEAIKYDLPRGASIPSTPLTVNNGGKSGFAHTLQMFIPAKDQATRDEIVGLANYGRVVWIVVIDGQDPVARVFGNDSGLSLTAYDELLSDPSKGGGIDATFSTPADTTMENRPPVNFYDTDRPTTLAALDALMTPAP